MKKMMIVIGMMMVGTLVNAEVTKEMLSTAISNGVEAVTALLPQCVDERQSNVVKSTIVSFEPKGNKANKAEALGMSEIVVSYFGLYDMQSPSGELNTAVINYLKQGGDHRGIIGLFKASLSTKEECIEAYELMLKNIPLTETTKNKLGAIKGELLKLKGL